MTEKPKKIPEYWKSLQEQPPGKGMPSDLPNMTAYVPFRKTKSSLVQISVPNNVIMRRITSYQACKREEVNRENVIEFCHAAYNRAGQSCARVDSVVTKRTDCKSHVKVYRVVNEWGPQLGIPEPGREVKAETAVEIPDIQTLPPAAIDERLFNAELHLKVGCPVPQDVYARLKNIELRILNLEGISPEYADEIADRVRLTDGQDVPHIPLNKRRYSKYELRRRLSMLKSNLVGKKLKSTHERKKRLEAAPKTEANQERK